jgi:hypothetical protein
MKNRNIILGVILCVLACFGLSPTVQAVSPPPDGVYGGSTAEGFDALLSQTNLNLFNTAMGWGSLALVTAGDFNTGVGAGSLLFNEGAFNTAAGAGALFENTIGDNNTGIGTSALFFFKSGDNNIALGFQAGKNLDSGDDNIYIGNAGGSSSESKRIRIGSDQTATFVAGISGTPVDGDHVCVTSDGQLGTCGGPDHPSAMLLNDLLKEHKAFVQQQHKVEKLEAALRAVNERLAEQDAKIQKVSAQLELNKPAPQVVENKE